MGKKRQKRHAVGPVEEDILQHLSTGDFLMSVLMSGRSTRAFYREAYKRAHLRYKRQRSIAGLEKKGLVQRHGDLVSLTKKGEELLEILASRSTAKDLEWKGDWWIIMYDIPVSLNSFRFELRSMLIRAGFRKLQHSVWIHPHHCKEVEIFLKNHPRVSAYVRYLDTLPFTGLETLADWKKLSTA